MFQKQTVMALLAGVLALGSATAFVSAQQDGGNAPPPPGQGQDSGRNRTRGGGGFNPDQMWQQFKEQLGSSDDEWKVLQPKIEKVFTMQMDTRTSVFGNRSSRGGDRGGDRTSSDRGRSPFGGNPDSAVSKAKADLQSALDDKSISNEEIAKRLDTLRQAREQAKQELAKAQAELKELLSQRQEALLVSRGMLD